MRLSLVLLALVFTVIGFVTCRLAETLPDSTSYTYQLPIGEELKEEDQVYNFLAETGFDYEFNSGTSIHIPADALIDQSGKRVQGNVELYFQEYRDALDLFSIGVQLNLDGELSKTAGAFQLKIKQGDQALLFDPSQVISINQATYDKEEDYSLYYLDSEKQIIDSLLTIVPTINEAHVQLERQIKRMKPQIKFPLDEDYFSLSYKGILDVMYNEDFINVNHQLTQKKMANYGLRWSNINVEAFIDYNGKKEFAAMMLWRNVSRKPIPDWTKGGKGTLEQINKNRYRLRVTSADSTRHFSTQIAAVMPLSELFDLGPGYWKKDYELKINQIASLSDALNYMPSAYRQFSINKFGLYSWQKRASEESSVTINATFRHLDEEVEIVGCYYLSGDAKGLKYYPKSHWPYFEFYTDPDAQIFAVSPDKQIYYYPSQNLMEIEFEHLQKMNNPAFIFEMESAAIQPKSVHTFRQLFHSSP